MLLGIAVFVSVRVATVDALIPSVVSVVSYDVGSVASLRISALKPV